MHMNSELKSVLMHTLELAVCVALAVLIAYVAQALFAIDLSEELKGGMILALGAAFKTIRVSPSVPVKDYVNE